MSDQLTPVLGYRRLVAPDQRTAPSFLFESVEGGAAIGRHSYVGAQPALEVIARAHEVSVLDHRSGTQRTLNHDNPLAVARELTSAWRVSSAFADASQRFAGGWVGYAGYDAVRYLEPERLPFTSAPRDDRNLPDLHFGLYRQIGAFDHVEKVLYAISHVVLEEHASVEAAYRAGCDELDAFVDRLETHAAVPLPPGAIDLDLAAPPPVQTASNFKRTDFERSAARCKDYISAGDAFQVVLSQRFERETTADPFEIYRALRIVNPSPYMIYLQASGAILVASSPEILCRSREGVVTSRPLAGTRKRGSTAKEDQQLEHDLLGDAKERAEHVMLVDLGRNDLGRVCDNASIRLERIMEVERYSHVMHLSSTLTGRLRNGLDGWDVLRHTLPVGTVSGAPKVRAMQIIDELEPTRRGPYAGGIGAVDFHGNIDMAIALRTLVIPTSQFDAQRKMWQVQLQAGAGIVADSIPAAEYEETVNKAAALGRAIDLAEQAFGHGRSGNADNEQ